MKDASIFPHFRLGNKKAHTHIINMSYTHIPKQKHRHKRSSTRKLLNKTMIACSTISQCSAFRIQNQRPPWVVKAF